MNDLDPIDAEFTVVEQPSEHVLFGLPMMKQLKMDINFKSNKKDMITIEGKQNNTPTTTQGELFSHEANLFTPTSHRRLLPHSCINLHITSKDSRKIKKVTVVNNSDVPEYISKQTPIIASDTSPDKYCTCRTNTLPENESDKISDNQAISMIKTGIYFNNDYKRDGVGAKDR